MIKKFLSSIFKRCHICNSIFAVNWGHIKDDHFIYFAHDYFYISTQNSSSMIRKNKNEILHIMRQKDGKIISVQRYAFEQPLTFEDATRKIKTFETFQ